MVEAKFDEIVMLVHPLFDIIGNEQNIFVLKKTNISNGKLIFSDQLDKKEVELFKKQVSVSLAVYRKTIKEYKAPNRFFLIVYPYRKKDYSDIRGFFNKQLVDYMKSELKNQFKVYPEFSLGYVKSELDNVIPKLKPKVKIIAFGEWADGCVPGQIHALTKFLVDHNICVVDSKILVDRSIKYNDFEKDLGKDFKHRIISWSQKREQFREFKSNKQEQLIKVNKTRMNLK